MSEFTENDLVQEIVRAAGRVEEIDLAEITARPPAALTGEPDLPPDTYPSFDPTTGHVGDDGVVLDLTRESNDRTRGTDDMTKRLWIIGLAAAAMVAVLFAVALNRDADSVVTDDNIPTTTAPATTTSEPDRVETGRAPTPTTVAKPLIEGETIAVGGQPRSPVEFNGQLWAFSFGSSELQRIDHETNEIVERIPVGETGHDPPIHDHLGAIASEDAIWVPHANGTLYRVDPERSEVLQIDLAKDVSLAMPVIAGDSIWVPDRTLDVVYRVAVATGEVTATIPVGPDPRWQPVATADSIWVASSCWGCGEAGLSPQVSTITRIDINSEATTTIELEGFRPVGPVAAGDSIWVPDQNGMMARINSETGDVTQIIKATTSFGRMAPAVAGGSIWAAGFDTGTLIRIDIESGEVVDTIDVGKLPQSPLTAGDSIWVSNRYAWEGEKNTLQRVNVETGEVTNTYAVGAGPQGAIEAFGSVWVVNYDDGTLTRIDIE